MAHFYKVDLNNTEWEIPDVYEQLESIGKGSYGQVCKAVVKSNNMSVAIKKLGNVFDSEFDAKTTYRELRLLKHINHNNVINLLDVFSPQLQDDTSLEDFEQIYLVTPLVAGDLENIMSTEDLTEARIQYFVYQMLLGLKYLHSVGIIHRDIKPANIGVNEDCSIRILDFGYARPTNDNLTGKLVSLWYGAPECALNWMDYSEKVDIWSIGCIMAELLTGEPLFPGDDDMQQLHLMIDILGKPRDDFMQKISEESGREYIESLPPVENPTLRDILENIDPLAIDLLEKMLEWDPEKRISAEEALEHPYLQDYYEPSEEQEEPQMFEQKYEDQDFPVEQWKELIYDEVINFTPPLYYNEV